LPSTLSRVVRDNITKLGLAAPAFWAYGAATAVHPRTIISNANYRRRGAPDHLPIPPSNLIFLVSGTAEIAWFLKAGSLAAESISDALRASGAEIRELGAILDFGCGCGRVLRHWHSLPRTKVYGTDINPKLVEWVQQHLPFARVQVNELAPPLAYPDASFDLIYALSVFTHLTEDLQTAWMTELARVLNPSGHLVVSTHGDAYLGRLDDSERQQFLAGQLVVKNNTKAPGSNTCSAYHPVPYVRNVLAGSLEVVAFVPRGAKGNPQQDLYVFRKPGEDA